MRPARAARWLALAAIAGTLVAPVAAADPALVGVCVINTAVGVDQGGFGPTFVGVLILKHAPFVEVTTSREAFYADCG